MKTKKDNHDLYLKFDLSLLADVFEKSLSNGLFLRHYLSVSSLSWDTVVKMTKIGTELISDPDT